MGEIFTDPESAFFKSAIAVDVGPLDREAFATFLAGKFALGERVINKNALARIIEIAANVPGDAQELCEALRETTRKARLRSDAPARQPARTRVGGGGGI